jgi:hypothetical protein
MEGFEQFGQRRRVGWNSSVWDWTGYINQIVLPGFSTLVYQIKFLLLIVC